MLVNKNRKIPFNEHALAVSGTNVNKCLKYVTTTLLY